MKKWIYLLIVTVTIYLNLLYEWKEGGSVLAAEIIFLLFCLMMAVFGGEESVPI